MFLRGKEIWIKPHAIKRARQRKIDPRMIEATIKGGNIKEFGKHYIKFSKRYKRGTVICLGEDLGQNIIIKTIEWGN